VFTYTPPEVCLLLFSRSLAFKLENAVQYSPTTHEHAIFSLVDQRSLQPSSAILHPIPQVLRRRESRVLPLFSVTHLPLPSKSSPSTMHDDDNSFPPSHRHDLAPPIFSCTNTVPVTVFLFLLPPLTATNSGPTLSYPAPNPTQATRP